MLQEHYTACLGVVSAHPQTHFSHFKTSKMNLDWIILTEENHPVPEKLVLAFGINQCGKGRVVRAFYEPKFSVEDSNEYDAAEYSEEKDEFFLKEGWYECNECEEFNWMIDFDITHYTPLPDHPISKAYAS